MMEKINELIDTMKDEIVRATQEIVQIKSVTAEAKPGMPFGEGINKSLEYALKLSETLGFRAVNVDGYMGYAEYGDGDEMIGVLGHLDVVPEGDGWKYPPYGGEIHDGKIYGRGTSDDKGPILAALYGLNAVKLAKLPLSKRVRILFGTNEERGSSEVEYYLAKEEAPAMGFTPDAEYPIIYAEKGIIDFLAVKKFADKGNGKVAIKYIKGGSASNVVPDYCEAELMLYGDGAKKEVLNEIAEFVKDSQYDITYEDKGSSIILMSKGISAHGSTPQLGKNAIMQLLLFLSRLDISGDASKYIKFFTNKVGMETDGRSLDIYSKDDTGELTLNLGVINVDCDGGSLSFNIRYPVSQDSSGITDKLNSALKSADIEMEDLRDSHPLYFPKDHPLILKLQKVYKEQTGLEPNLLAIGGGTYAKEMPNTVAFGPMFPGRQDVAHQANEYIEIDDLILNAKIYGNAIYELAK